MKTNGILRILLIGVLAFPGLQAQSQSTFQQQQEERQREQQEERQREQQEERQREQQEEGRREQQRRQAEEERQRELDQRDRQPEWQHQQQQQPRQKPYTAPGNNPSYSYQTQPNNTTPPATSPMPRGYSTPAKPPTVYTPHSPSASTSSNVSGESSSTIYKPSTSKPTVYTPHAQSSAASTAGSPARPSHVNGATIYTPRRTVVVGEASSTPHKPSTSGPTVYIPHAPLTPVSASSPVTGPARVNGVYTPSNSPALAVVQSPVAIQPLAAAQAQMQAAQTGCSQANAYQNYVNELSNSQNTTDQGIAQIVRTVADNTSDPNLQNALLNSIGQPNPINDALQQQLQNLAGTYENICQTRMANAQAALAQPQAPPATAMQGQTVDGVSDPATGAQSGNQAGAAVDPAPTGASSPSAGAPASAQPNASTDPPCPSVAAANLPSPNAPWGPWALLGNSGLVFDVSRVNGTTETWRFLNAGTNTITSMQFNYSYVDANSGQQATQSDILPFPLRPGQSVGGWTAYTANTRGDIEISITQMSCH